RIVKTASKQLAILVNDIKKRKKAEQELRESGERKAFLLKLSDSIRFLYDPVDIQKAITHLAMDYFRSDRCYYCEIENDQGIIRMDAARKGLVSVSGVYLLSDISVFKAVVDAGKAVVVADVNTS